jgi:D-3-phosphoglycerate dehydrogenase
LGYDPQNKVLGIVGMGGIGREVAARARAFGMKIQYYNRSRLSPELEQGAKYVSFEDLLQTSDAISLNCSLTKTTVGIIGKKEFEQMKDGVILVNTARGKLIDEDALVEALDNGKVFSAGLDVYEEEPKVHEGLLNNPNVVLLPHVGTATRETQVRRLPHNTYTILPVSPFTFSKLPRSFDFRPRLDQNVNAHNFNRKTWNYLSSRTLRAL